MPHCWSIIINQLLRLGAYRDFARAGGLMSYGTDLGDSYRRVGLCAARILKGDAPRDLPVTQSTKETPIGRVAWQQRAAKRRRRQAAR